jgi:hypothetical protein
MDRAATLPCPMMVVGVVMDAAPPNQSEATSAAFMEASASEGGVRLFPWQARTAHRRQPHDGKLQQISKMLEFVGAEAKPNLTVLVHRRSCRRRCSIKKRNPACLGAQGSSFTRLPRPDPSGLGAGGWGIGSRLHFHQQTNKASPPSKFTSEFC